MALEQADRERLARIADFLQIELDDVRTKFSQLNFKSYSQDRDLRRNVERCVENIINASLDAAKVLLVCREMAIPDTYREYFLSLHAADLLDKDTADILAEGVRLRNVLAHRYLDIRWKRVESFLRRDWKAYEGFLTLIKKEMIS